MSEIFAYERIPYSNHFFMQTHPDALATSAILSGLKPQPIESCRVLEIGCGKGINLISQALYLPESEFVGIDLAENHIVEANKTAAELGAINARFLQKDIMEMSVEEFGKFDYITAHGVFSWVPEFVREKILSLYREMLTENGIGYISYNAFPGAYYFRLAQNIAKFHTRNIEEPQEKVRHAVSFIKFLGDSVPEKDVYKFILQNEAFRYSELPMLSIYHDNLAEENRAFYFHEFAELLNKNGLQYLAESEKFMMSTQGLSEDASEFINRIPNVIEREQYLDFFFGRTFRQTLCCHKSREIRRDFAPEVLQNLYLASPAKPQDAENFELTTLKDESFIGFEEFAIEVSHPLTKAALFILGETWGNSVHFPKLLDAAKNLLESKGYATSNWEEQFQIAGNILLQILIRTTMIKPHSYHPQVGTNLPETPKVSKLVQWQTENSDTALSALNVGIKLDDEIARRLLKLSDGTRNKSELSKDLEKFISESAIFENKDEILKNLPDDLDYHLENFSKLGFFSE